MGLMPRNVPLAVAWRLLLLIAAATVVLAIGIRQYQWRPFGEKKMPTEQTDEVGKIIRQDMGAETPAPLEQIGALIEQVLPATEASPVPVETPTPAETPEPKIEKKPDPKAEAAKPKATPTPKPKPKSDEKALEELLEEEMDK